MVFPRWWQRLALRLHVRLTPEDSASLPGCHLLWFPPCHLHACFLFPISLIPFFSSLSANDGWDSFELNFRLLEALKCKRKHSKRYLSQWVPMYTLCARHNCCVYTPCTSWWTLSSMNRRGIYWKCTGTCSHHARGKCYWLWQPFVQQPHGNTLPSTFTCVHHCKY